MGTQETNTMTMAAVLTVFVVIMGIVTWYVTNH